MRPPGACWRWTLAPAAPPVRRRWPHLLKLTSTARNSPSGAEGCGWPPTSLREDRAVTCRPVARFSTCTPQRAAHDGAQAIWVALAAITAAKVRLACRVAGFHQLVGHRPAPRRHRCQQQAAVGPLIDQIPGRKPGAAALRGRPFFMMLTSRAVPEAVLRIGAWRVAGQAQRASAAPGATASARPTWVADCARSARK